MNRFLDLSHQIFKNWKNNHWIGTKFGNSNISVWNHAKRDRIHFLSAATVTINFRCASFWCGLKLEKFWEFLAVIYIRVRVFDVAKNLKSFENFWQSFIFVCEFLMWPKTWKVLRIFGSHLYSCASFWYRDAWWRSWKILLRWYRFSLLEKLWLLLWVLTKAEINFRHYSFLNPPGWKEIDINLLGKIQALESILLAHPPTSHTNSKMQSRPKVNRSPERKLAHFHDSLIPSSTIFLFHFSILNFGEQPVRFRSGQ